LDEDIGTLYDVTENLSTPHEREIHWNAVHLGADGRTRSWYQSEPVVTFQLLDDLGVGPEASFIDVGGGESNLVDHLLARNFTDVTVLDISTEAIQAARRRVGTDQRVTWLVEDVLTWKSHRRYDVWHDRAVFHFLAEGEIDVYRSLIDRSLAPDGAVILATFALNGPEYCSGLPVQRYGVEDLAGVLGDTFELVTSTNEMHVTPSGVEQPFTWIAARRKR
jgi:2-polyprenyl-3-methyl-5-hydroxy-6-metoxy-1,4-benzoquinol methylase